MTDQPSTTDGDDDEVDWDDPESLRFTIPPDPNRPPGWPGTIPTDFIYDAETDSYYAPGNEPGLPPNDDTDALMRRIEKTIEEVRRLPPIPKEQLQIPGWVLAKTPKRRKSRTAKHESRQRTLFSNDDDPPPEEQPPAAGDAADEESADEDP